MTVRVRGVLGQWLNWLWRWVMTGLCFTLFGLGGVLLSLGWFNFLLLMQPDKRQRRLLARRSIAVSFRLFLTVARWLGVLDYQLQGIEKIQGDKGCLIVANHPTLLDYVILAALLPQVDCLVKAELLRNPFVNGAIQAADYLINSEAPRLLSACRQRLQRGDNILIFPEGTRTRPGKPLKLQRGAANVAVRCECDLRLVHIHCSQQTLDKQSRWYQIPPRKPVFNLVVGERISSESFAEGREMTPALAARQLNRQLALLLALNQGKPWDLDDAKTLF